MSGYTLTVVETTLIIERSETNLNPVISSLDDSYMYIHTGIEILTNKYQGLSMDSEMDSENIHNLITELRQVFTYSDVTYFLQKRVTVSIMFEVWGSICISAKILWD